MTTPGIRPGLCCPRNGRVRNQSQDLSRRPSSLYGSNLVFVPKARLPEPMLNRIIRIAAFQNPEFYKAQAMRLPIWDKPRVISCCEEFAQHLALPRGCLEEVSALLKDHSIGISIRDERYTGKPIAVNFQGHLRDD